MKLFSVIFPGALFAFMFWMFDIRPGEALWLQHESESFSSTQGMVRFSEVTITHGSKGSVHYHVAITYDYTVNGLSYTGYRYRYDGHPGNSDEVHAIVAAHPVGSAIEVYYDPPNPLETVLSQGVDTQDVSVLFIFTPFSFMFLYLVVKAIQELYWSSKPVAGGVKLITEMMITRVRLPRVQPWMVGLPALAGLSLVAGILMASGAVSGPPLAVGGWLLAGVLLAAALAYGWQYWNVYSGRQDLVIDEGAQTILLPLTYKRRSQTPLPFSSIKEVALKKVRHQRKGGVFYTYMVALEMKDDSIQNLTNMNQARSEALAAWLKEKFGLTGITPVLNPEA